MFVALTLAEGILHSISVDYVGGFSSGFDILCTRKSFKMKNNQPLNMKNAKL